MELISNWIRRQLANPQLVGLVLVLSAVALTIYLAGRVLAPVFAAMIIAYLLTGLVRRASHLGDCNRRACTTINVGPS